MDGDGDLDLFVGNSGYYIGHTYFPGPNELYRNSGTGLFADVTAAVLPAIGPLETFDVAAGDADGDGAADLAIAESGELRLYLNNGVGVFATAPARLPPAAFSSTSRVAWVDLDGSGSLDLALGSTPRMFLNDGAGRFVDFSFTLPPDLPLTSDLAVGDVDGNGDPDLLYGAVAQSRLLLNRGGTFVDATTALMPTSEARPMVFGDVDGDGDPDLVLGSEYCCSGSGALLVNDGDGRFERPSTGGLPADSDTLSEPLVLADVDGDGDGDLLFLGRSPFSGRVRPRLYSNDGAGTFVDATAGRLPALNARTFVAGDVDGDGDVDLVLGVSPGAARLYLNDGTGVFTDTPGRLPVAILRTTALALGDADGDGDLDLFVGIADYENFSLNRVQLWRNDGVSSRTSRRPRCRARFR
jgi:hypothetical protein